MEPVVSLSPLRESILSPQEDARIDREVARLREKYGIVEEMQRYAPYILDAMPSSETILVLVDDLSAIDHIERVRNVGTYCSRAFTRARQGDIVLVSIDRIPGYHDYMDLRLQLGNSHYVYVAPNDPDRNYHLFESLKNDRPSLEKILAYASMEKELVLHPYMGSYGAWDISALLSQIRDQAVKVMGPLPIVSKIANNKNCFLSLVKKLCGKERTIDFDSTSNREELDALIQKKAEAYDRIVLRFPGSASGIATEVIESDFILKQKGHFEHFLNSYIQDYKWKEGEEDLQVSGWEPYVLMAPSGQLWIPPEKERFPLLEEILLQIFDPENPTVFSGSQCAHLPSRLNEEIESLAIMIARALQKLGYMGRCSFDFLVCGPSIEKGKVKFVECNGRWGGASTPLTLMNRIFKDHRKHGYAHRTLHESYLQEVSFNRFLEVFDDILYDSRLGKGYAIVYNVALLESKGQLDLITIGSSLEEAIERSEEFQMIASKRLG